MKKKDDDLEMILDTLKKERLWIRGHDLDDFIRTTNRERLNDISNIIGYENVSKIKEELKKIYRLFKYFEKRAKIREFHCRLRTKNC